MKRQTVLLIGSTLLSLGLMARQGSPQQRTSAPAGPSYTLTINFHGLIAWKVDGGAVWALLPDADYDPSKFGDATSPDELPPGVKKEALAEKKPQEFLSDNYPPHRAEIQVDDAEPVKGLTQGKRLLVGGSLVSLEYDSLTPGLGLGLGDVLSSERHMKKALNEAIDEGKAGKLGILRADVLTDLQKPMLPKGVATALRLRTGVLRTFPDMESVRVFSVKSRAQAGCPIKSSANRLLLAEQATLSDRIDGGKPIRLTFLGKSYDLKPAEADKGITINLTNTIAYMTDHQDDGKDHPKAFRWFYNLTKKPPASDSQYYPCCLYPECTFGGNKCPFFSFQ